MNKSSRIFVIIIICVIIIIVGYALFSESISVKGSATASGGLELEFTDIMVEDADGEGTDYEDVNTVIEGNKLTITGKLLKPNTQFVVTGNIKNIGTVDAKFVDITANPSFNITACDFDNFNLDVDCEKIKMYKDENTGIYFLPILIDSNGNPQLDEVILTTQENESNKVSFGILIQWDQNWSEPITESKNVEFTATFNFVQAQ